MLSPAEFHYALKDWNLRTEHLTKVQDMSTRQICESLRLNSVVVHNAAFGRRRGDLIKEPAKLYRFGWEKQPPVRGTGDMPPRQSEEQMKQILMAFVGKKSRKKQKVKRG